jgi:HAD superfamily hydrolase (TIGR01509 family)
MLRTLLFDLGNVLVHFSHERMCRQIGALVGRDGEEVRRELFDSELLRELECGRVSEADLQQDLERRLDVEFDTAALRCAASDIFILNAPLRPLLDELKRAGYRLVLLSNTSVTHYDWVRTQFDVMQPFDACVLSFEVGAAKPEAAIFERALEVIECEPAECFYTDDIPAYVARGREFGLDAELFTDAATLCRQLHLRGVTTPSLRDA